MICRDGVSGSGAVNRLTPQSTYAAGDLVNATRVAAVRSGVDEAALTRGLSVRASGAMMCLWKDVDVVLSVSNEQMGGIHSRLRKQVFRL